jgi:molecular chaperone HtpG
VIGNAMERGHVMTTESDTQAPETKRFEAEVGQLLNLMANALYSHKEVFLRELISNSSDACDRLRYAAITQPELTEGDADLKVTIATDKKKRTVTLADNGIGMNRDDLIENLGTIARSGTANFVKQMTGDAAKDVALIGQFGVGFYASFMVADRITVTTAKAGEDTAWQWVSEGTGEYTVGEVSREFRGTRVELHLRKGENEFLEETRLRRIITTYSDHIALPIVIEGKDGGETVNTASALWRRPKKDIEAAQYTEFYHHVAHAFDDPWLTLHNKAEGRLEYTNLLFVPSSKPFDLFDPERKHRVKLYVKRVFITDDCEDLMPSWLRFVRGVVDSEDLPLNISREMLQHNPVVTRIRKALVKRVLNELAKKAAKAPEDYDTFWDNFGAVLKEGLYESDEYREQILDLIKAPSTASDGLVGLAQYVERMKPGQDDIYYIIGEELEGLRHSPQIEGLAARGVEVLLFTDPIDEFWTGRATDYKGKPFKSATRGDIDLSKIEGDDKDGDEKDEKDEAAPEIDALIAAFKVALGDAVKDVRVSARLTDSPVCLVADEGGLDIHMERLLKQHNQLDALSLKVLELNPSNGLVKGLAALAKEKASDPVLDDAAKLLLDQARIIEGEAVPDPAAFSRRMTAVMQKGLL